MYEIHGPMYQFECNACQFMGDCWDTLEEAKKEAKEHDCLKVWRDRIPTDVWNQLVGEAHGD